MQPVKGAMGNPTILSTRDRRARARNDSRMETREGQCDLGSSRCYGYGEGPVKNDVEKKVRSREPTFHFIKEPK